MILLDPDLDPALPAGKAAEDAQRLRSKRCSRNERIPNARRSPRFLREAQSAVKLRGQVTVLLTTDTAIRRLNRQFRGKNKATDVLSFPADATRSDARLPAIWRSASTPRRRQAEERGHSLAMEIKVLMLHGLLHLAGYDHETDDGEMARREEKLRTRTSSAAWTDRAS